MEKLIVFFLSLSQNINTFFLLWLLNIVRNPPGRLADLVVNARLLLYSTSEPCRGDADQGPPAVEVDDQRSAAVAQTRVAFALFVAGAKHLVVQLDGDSFFFVPHAASAVVDDRH